MKNQNKSINWNLFIGLIILIIMGSASSFLGIYIIKTLEKPQGDGFILEQPSQFPDFNVIKGEKPDPKIKGAKITINCPESGCKNDKPATVDFDGIKKRYKVSGEFARGYLYMEALVDYERPLTTWDDFYFAINGFGGHLISGENSLPVPPASFSRYLYDLRSISYYPTIRDKERNINKKSNIDFFNFLQNGSILNIWTTISSNRPGRIMKEVSLYYECLEGSNCSIEEIK